MDSRDREDTKMDTADKVGVAVVFFIIASFVTMLFNVVTADGRADYCYIEVHTNTVATAPDEILYKLMAHRSWRPDREIIVGTPLFEDVVAGAALIDCDVR